MKTRTTIPDAAKTKAELASIAAGIAEQLDRLKPDEAKKVIDIVDVMRGIKRTTSAPRIPDLSPPSDPPLRRRDIGWPQSGLIS